MKTRKLKVGRIHYANLYPLFYYLDNKCDNSGYSFIKGVPSKLNNMLSNGELDISPSSSIEYLRHKSKYQLLPWFSVSSFGPISSILLFSNLPINELGGKKVAVSFESETSTNLLKIILKEFYSIKCKFSTTNLRSVKSILSSHSAVLHIGDNAMKEAKKISSLKSHPPSLYIYDLGELWNRFTGLPFVYALWVVRKKSLSEKAGLVRRLTLDLMDAQKFIGNKFPLIAKQSPHKKWFSEKELVNYWEIISYDFSEKHMEGLALFEKLALGKK